MTGTIWVSISEELGITDYSTIVNWELELFDTQPAQLGGLEKDFVLLDSTLEFSNRSELSIPMTGTIWVSWLNGPFAGEKLVKIISEELGITDYSTIVNWELELFDTQPAQLCAKLCVARLNLGVFKQIGVIYSDDRHHLGFLVEWQHKVWHIYLDPA
jgi:phosphohistidine swiveling domain-containing protein